MRIMYALGALLYAESACMPFVILFNSYAACSLWMSSALSCETGKIVTNTFGRRPDRLTIQTRPHPCIVGDTGFQLPARAHIGAEKNGS